MKAVTFDEYGGVDVLKVRDVPAPTAGPGRVLVRVRAASVNPGEISIREGWLEQRWHTDFPSGEGSDLSGIVEQVGDGVEQFAVGDAVLGWTDERGSQAELVSVPVEQLAKKPDALSWEVAGSMYVAPMAGYASVQAVAPQPGEVVVVSGAVGGVGSVAAQLARRTGATVIGLSSPSNHDWLRARDIIPVAYGEGQADRIREAAGEGVNAFIDTYGDGYVDLAIALGVKPQRINTVIDWDSAARVGAQTMGSTDVASSAVLAEIAGLIADGELEIPIAHTYPLERVRDAYRELAERHTRGKIVLVP